MKRTLPILLTIASIALALSACNQGPNTMTTSEVVQWKLQHPFKDLPEGTIIVDENGEPIKK